MRRILLGMGLAVGLAWPLAAQSYQSSFSNVAFDRAKGPGSFSSPVNVEVSTGAASLTMPFGPGIGARGAAFRPTLGMRAAPQLAVSSNDENVFLGYANSSGTEVWGTQTVDTLYQRGYGSGAFSPGTLDLGTMVSPFNRNKTTYSLPGGGGGRVLGQVPAGVTPATVQTLLAAFGYTAGDTVGFQPGLVTRTTKQPMIEMGSDGSLIVGLRAAGPSSGVTDEISADIQQMPNSPYAWDFPRRVVVISGGVAQEFHYVHHSYMSRKIPYLAIPEKTQLYSAHYVLTTIRNKFDERIEFTYDSNGLGYTATWSKNPTIKIKAEVVGTVAVAPGNLWLSDSRFSITAATQIRVSYLGLSQPTASYLLELADPKTGGALHLGNGGGPDTPEANSLNGVIDWDGDRFNAASRSVQPIRVVQESSPAQEVRFGYTAASAPATWSSGSLQSITPTVLSSVTFPTRTVSLLWEQYWYRMNYGSDSWGGYVPGALPGRPAIAYGVTRMEDSDGTQVRTTSYKRVIPGSNWSNLPLGQVPPDQWVSTLFYTAVTHPDQSVTVHRFVPPPATNATAGADGMQNLGFLKLIEQEIRYYAQGTSQEIWQADVTQTNPSNLAAYKWVVKDRYDVRSLSSPTGNLLHQSVPYPTRVRSWDRLTRIWTVEETTDWDANAGAWKQVHASTSVTASPEMAVDYLSLAQKGQAYTPYALTFGSYRRTDRTYAPNPAGWIFARESSSKTTLVSDSTGTLSADITLPHQLPQVSTTYHASINRVESVQVQAFNGLAVTTGFTYQADQPGSGLQGVQLASAFLNSASFGDSGKVGVHAYGYDANGYMASITQKPNDSISLVGTQESDELGRPKSQTDPNGTVRTFGWDATGRLTSITSNDGDFGTTISYSPDFKGVTLTRGLQTTELRYNGFGELILERRKGPDGLWSHRMIGRDVLGRETGQTIWYSGNGNDHLDEWRIPELTLAVDTVVPLPDRTVCKKWGFDEEGNAVCLTWQTIPGGTTTQTTPAKYKGSASRFDEYGRVVLVKDAAEVRAETAYFGAGTLPPGVSTYRGPSQRTTVGGDKVRWQVADAVGRLTSLITPVTKYSDPLTKINPITVNLRTDYQYDAGGRLKAVLQMDEQQRVQTRTWNYNPLGWLESVTQPESGTTTYSDFTVAGKARTTNYNGKLVSSGLDWLGRITAVTAADGSLQQTFVYDTGANGKGRLKESTDGRIKTTYAYASGQGKRLESLTTTAVIQGVSQSWVQSFGYDAYGQRNFGHTSHEGWSLTFHEEAGLPKKLMRGTSTLADLPWASGYDPVSWAVKAIVYGNGAASVFDHAPDQSRISRMRHLDAQMNVRADWEYAYDAAGNIVREYDRTRPEGSSFAFDQYTFDELNRLVAAVIQSPTFGEQLQQFDYDAFGNRTSSSIMNVVNWQGAKGASAASVTASALLDSPNRQVVNMAFTAGDPRLLKNQLPAFTAAGLATGADYDAQGNLKRIYQKPTTGTPVTIYLEYDAFGRVIQSTNGATGTVEKYHYSAEGLRILVEEYAGTTLAKTRINLYNDARQLVSQYEKPAAGAVVWKRDIFHLGTREAAEVDAAGMHVTQVDHLGSPRVITGPTGTLEGTQKYLPFGELLEQSGTFKTAKGFTNHEQTEASGLIYMQARFYLPWYGRFASPDPALDQHFTESQSWNIYAYVRNNPVMSTDPTGMWEVPKNLMSQDPWDGQSPNSQAQGDGQKQGEKAADNGQKAEANPANNQKTGAQTETAGQKQLKAWAAETDPVAATLVVSTWDKKGSLFGLVGEDHGVGHVAIADSTSGAMLLSQFPADGKPGDTNVTRTAKETKAEEKRGPDHSFLVDVKDRGAFARQALAEAGKKRWTPMGIFGTQCAVSSTKSLYAGGSGAVDRTPFRWPGSLTRRLDGLAKVPGFGVTRADPKLVASIYGD